MSRQAWTAVALLAVTVAAAHADEGGVNVQSGETLFAQGTSLSMTYLYSRGSDLYRGRDRVSDPEDRVREENWGILGLSYGVQEDLTVSLVTPYVEHDETFDFGSERVREGDSGLGDVSLLAKYRYFFNAGEGWETTAAIIAGFQLPTGETDERGRGGARLDPELQLGSGSWDFFAGTAGTYEWDRFEVRAHALYQINTEGAQEFKHGDILTLGVGAAWRPLLEKYPGPEGGISAALTYQHGFGAYEDGHRVRDSGGDTLYATLGAFFSPRTGIKLGASFDYPLFQDLNGQQIGLDFRGSFTLTYVF